MESSTDIYGTFVNNLRKHPWTAGGLFVGVGAYSLAHGATALAAGLLARALAANPLGGELREGDIFGQVIGRLGPADLLLIGLFATGVKAIASTWLTFLEIRTSSLVSDETRTRAISALLERGQRFGGPRTLASLASRCRDLEQAIVHGVIHGGRAVAQLVPLCAALILLSPRLALIGTLSLVPFVIALSRLRKLWRAGVARAQNSRDQLLVGVDDLVANLDLWRTYAAGPQAQRSIAQAAGLANLAAARSAASRAALSGFNEVLAVLALLSVVVLAPHLNLQSSEGTLFGFAAVFFMAYRPLRDLGDARGWLFKGSLALKTIRELANEAKPCTSQHTPVDNPVSKVTLAPATLELVEFGAQRIHSGVTLRALPGELVAIVGPTGSGKTSLLRALLGLEAARGALRFGERDLGSAEIGPPARPFAWVPQEAPIVVDTLLGNVALFSDQERARRALHAIGGDSLLADLGDTALGPGGRPLSGGERRLVSLARALSSGLPVLLLDEPTEGLDADAQRKVLFALSELRGKRTLLIVTHRPEVWKIADTVVRLNKLGGLSVVA